MNLKRVMHVEDDESIRMIAELALVDVSGLELLSCASGQSALEQVESFMPDLILLDVMMPKMDGLETIKVLKERPEIAQIPVVFMTARIQESEKQQYIEAGAVAVMEKPFEPMELGDTLNRIYQKTVGH